MMVGGQLWCFHVAGVGFAWVACDVYRIFTRVKTVRDGPEVQETVQTGAIEIEECDSDKTGETKNDFSDRDHEVVHLRDPAVVAGNGNKLMMRQRDGSEEEGAWTVGKPCQ